MDARYYNFVRSEIKPLLPAHATKILEVGAASGATLKWLKSIFPNAQTTGVEINSSLLPALQRNADVAIIGQIEDCIPQLEMYDLILLLDVLEHLQDSLGMLQRLTKLLRPHTGTVIVSLPNIAHILVSAPLLFRRRFNYSDAGIMDRTHLRFFVEDTAVKLMNDAGLIVTRGVVNGLHGPKSKIIDRLTAGFFRHHLIKQYIMLGEQNELKSMQSTVRWQIGG